MTPAGPEVPAGPGTEAELIRAAQAGDMAAFEELVMTHADRLFAVLLRMTGSHDEAGDLAQEVLLRAWRGIGGFRGGSSFFTWLYRIAMNEAIRSRERAARRPRSVPLGEPGPAGSPGSPALDVPAPAREEPGARAEQRELRDALARALADLPADYRAAIVLRDIEGLSTRDAAEITGVSQAAFKSRLHQARLRVRAAVGDGALLSAG